MAYRIDFAEPLDEEYLRIALEQVDRSLCELEDEQLDIHQRVHQFRKRAKKIRALARLARPADESSYKSVNVRFRNLARKYAGLRDAQAMVMTFDNLIEYFADQLDHTAFTALRQNLVEQRGCHVAADARGAHLPELHATLSRIRIEMEGWSSPQLSPDVFIAGFLKTYGRGRNAFEQAQQSTSPEVWHNWRKRIKYQRYHWKLLRGTWPALINCWRDELHRLSDLTGDEHDLVELAAYLRQSDNGLNGKATEVLLGLIAQRRSRLRADALALGCRLFADKKSAIEARLKRFLN